MFLTSLSCSVPGPVCSGFAPLSPSSCVARTKDSSCSGSIQEASDRMPKPPSYIAKEQQFATELCYGCHSYSFPIWSLCHVHVPQLFFINYFILFIFIYLCFLALAFWCFMWTFEMCMKQMNTVVHITPKNYFVVLQHSNISVSSSQFIWRGSKKNPWNTLHCKQLYIHLNNRIKVIKCVLHSYSDIGIIF